MRRWRIVVYGMAITWMLACTILLSAILVAGWLSPTYTVTIDVNAIGEMYVEMVAFAVFTTALILAICDMCMRKEVTS